MRPAPVLGGERLMRKAEANQLTDTPVCANREVICC
jgi:hypothetical protein